MTAGDLIVMLGKVPPDAVVAARITDTGQPLTIVDATRVYLGADGGETVMWLHLEET